jgi:hypothetical protein
MEKELEGFKIYTDTPENRFEYTPESIWIVNPNTKGWVIELEKSEKLWYFYRIYDNFSKEFNEERSVFEQLINIWVEDVLKRGVSTTVGPAHEIVRLVEDVLKRGVSTTFESQFSLDVGVADVLKRGVSTTISSGYTTSTRVEDVFKRGAPINFNSEKRNITVKQEQLNMKNIKNSPFRITIEHWDMKSSIEINHSDITFQEYITLLSQISLSVGFPVKTVEDFFNQEI